MLIFYIILSMLTIVSAYDRGYKNSPCPKINPATNFNFTAYATGRWYEIARYSNDFVGKGDCAYIEHKYDGNECTFIISDVIEHKIASVQGTVKIKSKEERIGQMTYVGDFYRASENTNEVEVKVLNIDYDDYCILHHCKHNSKTKFHHEFIWILSRKQVLDEKSKTIINDLLKASVIDEKLLIWDHFTKRYCE